MKQPYKIVNITLITYSGKRIPVNYISNEEVRISKKLLLMMMVKFKELYPKYIMKYTKV